MLAGLFMQYKT